jgi:hypothetical protein
VTFSGTFVKAGFAGVTACALVFPAHAQRTAALGASPYNRLAMVPAVVNGDGLNSFVLDPVTQRLYTATDRGFFRADLSGDKPELRRLFSKRIYQMEFAPDLGRIFYLAVEEIGYVDVRANDAAPVVMARGLRPSDVTYEPTRRELYVQIYRRPTIHVFDAVTGTPAATIALDDWYGGGVKAVPGRVLMQLPNRQGIFSIDAATRTVAPWLVTGRIITPAVMEPDLAGKYLYAVSDTDLVAIDVATAAEVGRVSFPMRPRIAVDADTGWVIAAWADDPPNHRLVAYRVTEKGLEVAARLENPDNRAGVRQLDHGFMQDGSDLTIWSARK